MRIFIPIILFLLIACDDINNHEKLGSLTIAFNTSLIDSQPSNSLNRLENSESIAPINLAVIKIGDNSPININLTSSITNAYTATNLPSGPTQVIVELYSKGVLNIDELRFSQTQTVVIEGGQTVTAQFNNWIPDLSNMYFYDSFEEGGSNWITGSSNPFAVASDDARHGILSVVSGPMNNGLSYLRPIDDIWLNALPSTSPQTISIVYYSKSTCTLDIELGLRIDSGNSPPVELDTYRPASFWTRKEVQFSPNALANITGFYFDVSAGAATSDNCVCYIDYVQVY